MFRITRRFRRHASAENCLPNTPVLTNRHAVGVGSETRRTSEDHDEFDQNPDGEGRVGKETDNNEHQRNANQQDCELGAGDPDIPEVEIVCAEAAQENASTAATTLLFCRPCGTEPMPFMLFMPLPNCGEP